MVDESSALELELQEMVHSISSEQEEEEFQFALPPTADPSNDGSVQGDKEQLHMFLDYGLQNEEDARRPFQDMRHLLPNYSSQPSPRQLTQSRKLPSPPKPHHTSQHRIQSKGPVIPIDQCTGAGGTLQFEEDNRDKADYTIHQQDTSQEPSGSTSPQRNAWGEPDPTTGPPAVTPKPLPQEMNLNQQGSSEQHAQGTHEHQTLPPTQCTMSGAPTEWDDWHELILHGDQDEEGDENPEGNSESEESEKEDKGAEEPNTDAPRKLQGNHRNWREVQCKQSLPSLVKVTI